MELRNKRLLPVLCCLPLLLCGCAAEAPADAEIARSAYVPQGYTLAFAEEFDVDGAPDAALWGFDLGPWPYNEELECYTEENASVRGGVLAIEARAEAREGRAYTSARLTTAGKQDFLYGYLEIRAKVPTGRGTWSALWLLPSDTRYGGHLQSGEIDILEHVGYQPDRVYATLHTERNNSVLDNAIVGEQKLDSAEFHVYALLWKEDALHILVDGETSLVYTRPAGAESDAWPFDLPFHLVLNVAVGGSWGGTKGVDDSAFPQSMLVDYVRYYSAPTA